MDIHKIMVEIFPPAPQIQIQAIVTSGKKPVGTASMAEYIRQIRGVNWWQMFTLILN